MRFLINGLVLLVYKNEDFATVDLSRVLFYGLLDAFFEPFLHQHDKTTALVFFKRGKMSDCLFDINKAVQDSQ